MRKLIFISLLLITLPIISYAQLKGDYNWIMGYDFDHVNMTNDRINGFQLDFNKNPTEFEWIEKQLSFYLTSAMISDDEGNLQFYTNGCDIANASHEIMENGEDINPGWVHDDNCHLLGRGYSVPQGALVIPFPGQDRVYYLLHQRKRPSGGVPNNNFIVDGLYMTIVDMNLENGLGAVVSKNELIVQDTLDVGLLTATKHGNNQDWWILVSDRFSGNIYKLLLSEDGIEMTGSQDIDVTIIPEGSGGGQAVFSPTGEKYARYSAANELRIFDFDRNTGELSNFQLIEVPPDTIGPPPTGLGGVAFSASGKYIYTSTLDKIFQFDTEAANIQASMQLVAEWDGYMVFDLFRATFWLMQLGPDCRIYMTMIHDTNILHVIQEPDKAGVACNVQQHVQLPARNSGTMPNFPNYRLGIAPVCDPNIELIAVDSIPVSTTSIVPNSKDKIWHYPNPSSTYINIALDLHDCPKAIWRLYNSIGELILERGYNTSLGLIEDQVLLESVPSGFYTWQLQKADNSLKIGKILVTK